MKNVFKLFVLSFFLMAFQCDDDMGSSLVFNTFKTSVTPQSNFTLNDTIWVTGKISSRVFDNETNDSIFFNDHPFSDEFLVMKLINSNPEFTSEGAIDHFKIVTSVGDSYTSVCDESNLIAQNALGSDMEFYTYKIGFVPLQTADYVFSFRDATLTNSERNEHIIQNYLMAAHPGEIGFDQCGSYSYRILSETNREFYFTVR